MITDYHEIGIDLKTIFSLKIPKPKDMTGQAVYRNIYQITKEISKLGLLQEEISIAGKKTFTIYDLTKLNHLKQDFKNCLLQITEYWLIITRIINLEEIIQVASDEFHANYPTQETPPDFFKFTILDEVNKEILDTDNISFYIYLLLESFSEFCIAAKNLGLIIAGEETHCIPELYTSNGSNELSEYEIDEEFEDPNFFAICVRDFSFLLLLVKFIALKFGIDYDQSLQEYIAEKYS